MVAWTLRRHHETLHASKQECGQPMRHDLLGARSHDPGPRPAHQCSNEGRGQRVGQATQSQGPHGLGWVETYPEQVYFATRHDSQRQGDIVTMWTRVEYRHSQNPLQHRSSVSRDDWDCRNRRRSTTSIIFYKFNNLEDQTPERSTNSLPSWETIEVGTIGETLLDFACSIQSTTQVPLSLTAPRLNDAAHLIATESEFLFDADHRDIDGISVTE